ncbi:MAG: 30S ribosomal protein S18 [Chloroflexota bacterium]
MENRTENKRPARSADSKVGAGRGGARFAPKRRVCPFCAVKTAVIDYKDPDKLRAFISDSGKIEPRRKSGTCARHQRTLAIAIKRARQIALLPYTTIHTFRVQALSRSE